MGDEGQPQGRQFSQPGGGSVQDAIKARETVSASRLRRGLCQRRAARASGEAVRRQQDS